MVSGPPWPENTVLGLRKAASSRVSTLPGPISSRGTTVTETGASCTASSRRRAVTVTGSSTMDSPLVGRLCRLVASWARGAPSGATSRLVAKQRAGGRAGRARDPQV